MRACRSETHVWGADGSRAEHAERCRRPSAASVYQNGALKNAREERSVSIALGFASALDTGYCDLVNEHRDVEFGKH